MFDRNLMKLDGMHAIMMALVLLGFLQAAAVIGQALALGKAVSTLWAGAPMQDAVPDALAFFGCFAMLQLLRFAQETMLDNYSSVQAKALRDALLESTFDSRTMLVFDRFERPLLLFPNQFTLNFYRERFPQITLVNATEI